MAVIFGLDLKEMQWYKFGSKYMFGNRDYHLRRTKFIVYQIALIFCVISESLGTDVLSNFIDSQKFLSKHDPRAVEHNNSYVGMASYNIFAGVFVAFVFGAAFFFDLFWPARHEDRGIRLAWKGCSVAACIFMLADCICEIVIVTTKAAYVTGVSDAEATRLIRQFGGYPLSYKHSGRAIASVVFAWLGFVFGVIPSTIIMWMSINHTERLGPYSGHVRSGHVDWPSKAEAYEQTQEKGEGEPSEMNNLGGNHYEAPGYHHEGVGHVHEDPTQMREMQRPVPMAQVDGAERVQRPGTGERLYTGT